MMDFNTIPKYVISLLEREDRRQAFTISATEAGVTGYGFTPGIKIVRIPSMRERLKTTQAGCKAAHKGIIMTAKEGNYSQVMIFEDDAVFDKDFLIKFYAWSKEVPEDWDILYLGAHNHRPLTMISDHVGRCTYSLSTVGYIVRNTVYDLLIEELKQDKILDMIYATVIQPKANCYCFKPNLVTQAPGYSNIVNKFVDYSKYYK